VSPAIRTSTVLDVTGADALLQRRLRALEDTRPALRGVAAVIRVEYREQYRSGDGWPALTARYAARKAKRGGGSRVLVDGGALEASLTRTGVRYAKEKVGRDFVEVRSTDPVGNLLTNGTKSMVARDPSRISRRGVARRSREVLLTHLASGGR
jgi:hypothetical protein